MSDHLGGHLGKTHIDEDVFDYVAYRYSIRTMIDIGCGPAGMVKYARSKGVKSLGIDGDESLSYVNEEFSEENFYESPLIYFHDFTTGKLENPLRVMYSQGPYSTFQICKEFDLAWSVEFLEHVDEKFLDNILDAFSRTRFIVLTHAPPGTPGHHHVNCQPKKYWVDKFSEIGYTLDVDETENIRRISSMKKNFMRNNGLFFKRSIYNGHERTSEEVQE